MLRSEQLQKYDLKSLELKRDPFPLWRQMRADGPIVDSKVMIMGKCKFATTWQAANDVLRDQSHFVRNARNAGKTKTPAMRWWLPRRFRVLTNNMLTNDNKDHRRLRSMVDQAFISSQIESMREQIRDISDQLLNQLQTRAKTSPDRTTEFVSQFSRQLPLTVIIEILGLPPGDRAKFSRWFRSFSEVSSTWHVVRMLPGIKKLLNYLNEQFELVRKQPRPGLMGELVAIELDGDRLSRDELLSIVFLLLIAGHETTVHLLSNAVLALLQHPDQLELLRSNWDYNSGAVEEILRFMSPVQMTKPRFVTQDMEFHGTKLERGESVIAMIASANSDSAHFDDPESFDILRSPNSHLAFGTGVHVCLGLKLARAETEVALQQMFTRFPEIALAAGDQSVTWSKRIGIRAIKDMRLRLND